MKIAVIGAGIAGLGAAWALSRGHEVTLFERAGRAGGHADTRAARLDGRDVPVDTGFIVYNEVNYPHLTRLFSHLGVATIESDMSFAVSMAGGAWEMAGRPTGLFGGLGQLASPAHWRLIRTITRFFGEAEGALSDPAAAEETLGAWLDRHGYDRGFTDRFLVPMAAAIWSSDDAAVLDYPVRPFVRFFSNHGLLKLAGRVRWRTVAGGSRNYVERLLGDAPCDLRLGAEVSAVLPGPAGPSVVVAGQGPERFDAVVLGAHGDEARRMLADDADAGRRGVLGAFAYQPNTAVLHTDPGLMPRRRRLWSSWNYLGAGDGGACVTYWMNRLQGIDTRDQVFVTLNPVRPPRPETVVDRMSYDHPQFDLGALEGQKRLDGLQGRDGIWFCGSYTGYGFHEDGLRSGLRVAAALGAPAPWWSEADTDQAPWARPAEAPAEAA